MSAADVLKIFIGYDPREAIAYHVLAHSILTRASCPVSITPLRKELLDGIYTRPRGNESTEFTFTRFLVPHLCDDGPALFMDCDMLCMADIADLFDAYDDRYAVQVVKHEMPLSGSEVKFLGQQQTYYRRKNWASVMLFNCSECRDLITTSMVNESLALDLLQMNWCPPDEIGALDPKWNHLVGYDKHPAPALIHYTLGGPWFKEFEDCEFAEEWRAEARRMCAPWIHAKMLGL